MVLSMRKEWLLPTQLMTFLPISLQKKLEKVEPLPLRKTKKQPYCCLLQMTQLLSMGELQYYYRLKLLFSSSSYMPQLFVDILLFYFYNPYL